MIHRKISSRRCAALAAAAASITAGAVQAASPTTQPVTWVGAANTPLPYVDPANWNHGETPVNADNEFLMLGTTAFPNGVAQVSGTMAAEGAFLNIGMNPGESGELQISGGTLTLGELRVGGREVVPDFANPGTFTPNGGGTGSVIQSGGDVFITFGLPEGEPPIQSLYIGDAGLASGNTANGRYEISAGTLTSGISDDDAIVVGTGVGTQGTFIQSGGTVTSRGFVSVGRRGANSTYSMSGGTLNVGSGSPLGTSPNRNLWVGDGDLAGIQSTRGTFTQTNGIVNVGDATIDTTQGVEIGRRSAVGQYSISAGQLNVPNGGIVVGGGGDDPDGGGPLPSDPNLMQGSGTLTVSGSAAITVSDSATDGNAANNVSRGNMSIGFTQPTVAGTTTGLLMMTGGTMTFDDNNGIVAVGNGLGASGTLDLSGGTFSMTGTSALFDIGRNSSTGLVKVSGTGTLNVDQLTINSSNVAVTRELRIEGGTVNVDFWEQGAANTAATRVVNQTGGTLNVTNTGVTHRGGRLVTYNLTGGNTTFAGIFALDTSTMNIGADAGAGTSSTAQFNIYRNGSGTTNITGGSATFANVNDAGNQTGTVTMSGGTVNVTGNYNITNGTPASGIAGVLNLTGANATFNNLTTGGNSGAPNSTLYISAGNVAITNLTLSSTSILKTDNTVSLGANITMGDASVNVNTGSLALTGSLTSGAPRTLTKTGPGVLTISGAQSHVAGSAVTADAGTLNFNSNGGANLTVNANTTTSFGATQNLAALNVGGTATATLENDGSANRFVNANAVSIAPGARLDLKNNKLVTNTPLGSFVGAAYTGIQGEVQRAYNFGAWDQPGLTTSMPEAGQNAGPLSNTTTIATATASQVLFIEPTDTAVFQGQTVTGSSTIAMYTYAGDLNMDGLIDGADYGVIDNNVQFPGTDGYANGDLNYDGVIDGADYGIIDNAIQFQGAPFPGVVFGASGASSASLSGVTAVPEPSACGFALLGAAAMLGRRRRRSR